MKVKYGDQIVEVLTIGALAKEINRTPAYLRKMIERGLLPEANLRTAGGQSKSGEQVEGNRLYSRELVTELKTVFQNVKQGREMSIEQKQAIFQAFENEKLRLNL